MKNERYFYWGVISEDEIDRLEYVVSNDFLDTGINDIMERFQIVKAQNEYNQNNILIDSRIQNVFSDSNRLKQIVFTYINNLDCGNIIEIVNQIDFMYVEDFWCIINKTKKYCDIENKVFYETLNPRSITCVLLYKKIVEKFEDEIKKYFCDNVMMAELILDHYNKDNKYYLPANLTKKNIEELLSKYINSNNPNPNYLEDIIYMKPEFGISDRIKYKASQVKEKIVEELFSKNTSFGYKTSMEIFYDETQIEAKREFNNGRNLKKIYSSKWIKDNIDYPTLLNNLVYLLELVDVQGRVADIYKPNRVHALTEALTNTVKGGYTNNSTFKLNQQFSLMDVYAYCRELEKNNVFIEDVIKYFFEEYIVEEFKFPRILINIDGGKGNYLNKCIGLATDIESVLKQYKEYQETGEIDYEFITFSNTPTPLESIESLNSKKYVYPKGEHIQKVGHLLFSDQSILRLTKEEDRYDQFIMMILNKEMHIEDFENFKIDSLNYLIDSGVVKNDNGIVTISDKIDITIIAQLYYEGFINRYYYLNEKKHLDIFEEKGWIQYSNGLLSLKEKSYFNYYLNDREFVDGPKLRNKYVHGSNNVIEKDDIHVKNYFALLRLLMILIIKINEDLRIKDEYDEL